MITEYDLFIILTLLFVKHFVADFIFQTEEQVRGKGIYGNWAGITHSLAHVLGTFIVFYMFFGVGISLMFAVLDGLIHYHVDWTKININKKYNYTVMDKQFWFWLGLDQLAHSLTYVWFIWLLI